MNFVKVTRWWNLHRMISLAGAHRGDSTAQTSPSPNRTVWKQMADQIRELIYRSVFVWKLPRSRSTSVPIYSGMFISSCSHFGGPGVSWKICWYLVFWPMLLWEIMEVRGSHEQLEGKFRCIMVLSLPLFASAKGCIVLHVDDSQLSRGGRAGLFFLGWKEKMPWAFRHLETPSLATKEGLCLGEARR